MQVSHIDALIDPGTVSITSPGTASYTPSTGYSQGSVTYEWQSPNGEIPPDRVRISHMLTVEGELKTELTPYRMGGSASASSTINGIREYDTKVPDWNTPGAPKSFSSPPVNDSNRTQFAERGFFFPATISQVTATFDASGKNEAYASAYFDRGDNTYKGYASATSSRKAKTSGFSISTGQ